MLEGPVKSELVNRGLLQPRLTANLVGVGQASALCPESSQSAAWPAVLLVTLTETNRFA